MAFDATGRRWATEFGAQEADELRVVRPGRNYGWPAVEGRSTGSRCAAPAAFWSPTSSCSPAGTAIAGSTAFVGVLQGRCLFGVPLDGRKAGRPRTTGDHGRLRTVALAPDGSLWVTTSDTDGRTEPGRDDGQILRVRLTEAGAARAGRRAAERLPVAGAPGPVTPGTRWECREDARGFISSTLTRTVPSRTHSRTRAACQV